MSATKFHTHTTQPAYTLDANLITVTLEAVPRS